VQTSVYGLDVRDIDLRLRALSGDLDLGTFGAPGYGDVDLGAF